MLGGEPGHTRSLREKGGIVPPRRELRRADQSEARASSDFCLEAGWHYSLFFLPWQASASLLPGLLRMLADCTKSTAQVDERGAIQV